MSVEPMKEAGHALREALADTQDVEDRYEEDWRKDFEFFESLGAWLGAAFVLFLVITLVSQAQIWLHTHPHFTH